MSAGCATPDRFGQFFQKMSLAPTSDACVPSSVQLAFVTLVLSVAKLGPGVHTLAVPRQHAAAHDPDGPSHEPRPFW